MTIYLSLLLPAAFAATASLSEGHRVEQSAFASTSALILECTPLDKPVVTFDQKVKTSVSVAGNQIEFTPKPNEDVLITAAYTCP